MRRVEARRAAGGERVRRAAGGRALRSDRFRTLRRELNRKESKFECNGCSQHLLWRLLLQEVLYGDTDDASVNFRLPSALS
jgi:hypothetical protein